MADPAYEVRSVDRLLLVVNHGDDGREATRLYQQIMTALRANANEYGGKHKGSLAITVDFAIDNSGAIDVAITSKAKLPGRPVNRERFFLAKDDVLTLQDPARETLFAGVDLGRGGRRAPDAAE